MRVDPVGDAWRIGTARGRWAGLGPYYAMFPVSFARDMIETYSKPGDIVLDPFCGRGTTNYVSQALNRISYGCELNPVGWIYASTKTAPVKREALLIRRIHELADMVLREDKLARNEFQKWAWCPEVLGFLNCARRELNWKQSKVDRTLAAIILVYLHGKLGGSLSNQMRQSKSMAPDYAVKWWKSRKMRPPVIHPVNYLVGRVKWRYKKGLPTFETESRIFRGDARKGLEKYQGRRASMVLTSPPYSGVTNYEYDNWIRLWLLGGPALPDWSHKQRYANKENFIDMLDAVFSSLKKVTTKQVKVVVRTDFRRFTLETTAEAISKTWPNHRVFGQHTAASKPTQTALFGDKTVKPGEVDLIALPKGFVPPKNYIDMFTGKRV